MEKNVAGQSIGAQMISATNGSDFTGTVTVEVTIDSGTKTAGGGTVTHEGEGYHSYAPTQAETNGEHIAFSFAGTGAISATQQVYTSVDANVFALVGDETAATNIKNQYDGSTGLSGDLFPSTQAQVGNLAVGAGGLSIVVDSFVNTGGGAETNTFAATEAFDAIYHIVAPNVGVTDFYYEFDVGTTGAATSVQWDGYAQSNGDTVQIFGWDWIATAWVQVGTIAATNGITLQSINFIFNTSMTGTGANVGKVRIRFESSDATNTATDRILCEFTSIAVSGEIFNSGVLQAATADTVDLAVGANTNDGFYNHTSIIIVGGTGAGQERIISDYDGTLLRGTVTRPWTTTPDATSVYEIHPASVHSETSTLGYVNGCVFYDNVGGVPGTLIDVNGTKENPCSSWTDVQTIQTALKLTCAQALPGSSIILDQAYEDKEINGLQYGLDLNGKSIDNSKFEGSNNVVGEGIAAVNQPAFIRCLIGNVTLDPSNGLQCGMLGTFTLRNPGVFIWGSSAGVVPGVKVIIDYGALLNSSLFSLTNWGGGEVEIQNAGAGVGTYRFRITGFGDVTVNANCSADTIVELHGSLPLTNNGVGITVLRDASYTLSSILSDSVAFQGADIPVIRQDTETDLPAFITSRSLATADYFDFTTDTPILPAITANWLTQTGIAAGAFSQSKFGSNFITSSSFSTGAISDSALSAAAVSKIAADIVTGGALSTSSGALVLVNTAGNMRGTDDALLAASYTAPDNATIAANNALLVIIDNVVDAIFADTNAAIPASIAALPTALENAAALIAAINVDGMDLNEAMRIALSAMAGIVSGGATTTMTFKGANGSAKNRIIASGLDTDGNRAGPITLDFTL